MAALLRSPTTAQSPRRVLGDKSANFTPKRLRGTLETLEDVTEIKTSLANDISRPKRLPASPIGKVAGQKRSIGMVEAAERSEEPQTLGTKTEEKDEAEKKQEDSPENQEDRPRFTRQLSAMSSFHASQEGPLLVEEHFSIQEEMSQTAIDTLNETPLPLNQSHAAYPSFHAEQSQNSQGLSSLIDFDPEEDERAQKSSPRSEKTILMESISSRPLISVEARKMLVGEKANLLRERLRLAMYKIQTDQINKSLSELETSRRETRSPSLPSNLPNSLESRIAAARNLATAEDKPRVANLNSIAAPTLVPTQYSARYMSVEEESGGHTEIPSSPPIIRVRNEDDEDEEDAQTPRAIPAPSDSYSFKDPRTPRTPGSRQASLTETLIEKKPQELERTPLGKKTLTSSVVKGEAANSLLQLMGKSR